MSEIDPPTGRRLSGRQAIGLVVLALICVAVLGLVLGRWTLWIVP